MYSLQKVLLTKTLIYYSIYRLLGWDGRSQRAIAAILCSSITGYGAIFRLALVCSD